MHSGWDKRNGRESPKVLVGEGEDVGWRVSRVRVFENGSECRRRAAGATGVRTFADIEYLGPSITLGVAISESIGLTFVSISGIDLRAAHVLPPGRARLRSSLDNTW